MDCMRGEVVGFLFEAADGGNGNKHENGDDRHHDQQFHQSEAIRLSPARSVLQREILLFMG